MKILPLAAVLFCTVHGCYGLNAHEGVYIVYITFVSIRDMVTKVRIIYYVNFVSIGDMYI